jgi:hypothetical protein
LLIREEDRPRATMLAEALNAAGCRASVLTVGEAAQEADLVIVCWSSASGRDPRFAEAADAIEADRRIDVIIDRHAPYRGAHALDFSGWGGGARFGPLSVLRHWVKTHSVEPVRPSRSWKRFLKTGGRVFWRIVVPLGVIVGLVEGWPEVEKQFCQAFRGVCASTGRGGVPSAEQERAYQAALAGGCSGLADFVRRHPTNPRLEDARRLLDAAVPLRIRRWQPDKQSPALFVSAGPAPTRDAATEQLRTLAGARAGELCGAFAETGRWRMKEARYRLGRTSCESASDGWRCSAPGVAACTGARLVIAEGRHRG